MLSSQICEIVCLGTELLIGATVNTNATFIGKHLTKMGFEVRRITCIRDDLELAVEFFHGLFERKPNVVIVSGGLGPTYDDIQLAVISKATNIEINENQEALEQVREYYKAKGLELTKERRKMANMPINSTVLDNKVGGAPGCLIQYEKIDIFCLPGVPSEMKDIFT
ncbi:MAG: competence/damage-inducible protein A, partial [Candidatus Heimdallarchaeota archaeon]|nr:competence/damage-inducible protein A [Candidatus Heimdallarchaeota archaeon]